MEKFFILFSCFHFKGKVEEPLSYQNFNVDDLYLALNYKGDLENRLYLAIFSHNRIISIIRLYNLIRAFNFFLKSWKRLRLYQSMLKNIDHESLICSSSPFTCKSLRQREPSHCKWLAFQILTHILFYLKL